MLRVLLLIVLASWSLPLAAEELPIDSLFRSKEFLDVTMSPAGDRLATSKRVDGTVVIIVTDRKTQKVVGEVAPEAGRSIDQVVWVNNDRLLFSRPVDANYHTDFRRTPMVMAAVNFDGSDLQIIAGKEKESVIGRKSEYKLLDVLESDDDHVLIGEYPWPAGKRGVAPPNKTLVHRVNVHSGYVTDTEVLPFRNAMAFASNDGEIRFLTIEDYGGPSESLYRDSESGKWRPLGDVFNIPDDKMYVVAQNKAGDAVFLRGRDSERDYQTMYRLDLSDKTLKPLLADHKGPILSWSVDDLTGEVYAGKTMSPLPSYHFATTDSKIKTVHQAILRAFEGHSVAIAGMAHDASAAVVRVSNDREQGAYYVFDGETRTADFLTAEKPWLDPDRMRPVLVAEIANENGLKIPVRLTLPIGEAPAPLVLFAHMYGGNEEGEELWGFSDLAQLLASRGFAVVQVSSLLARDLGSDYAEDDFAAMTADAVDDMTLATRWAMEHPQVDGEHVCAMGEGLGAHNVFVLAAQEPELFDCLVGDNGFYDLGLLTRLKGLAQNFDAEGAIDEKGDEYWEQLSALSPVQSAPSIKAPVMLMVTKSRPNIMRFFGRPMRKSLKKAGGQVQWVELPRGKNRKSWSRNITKRYERMLNFLDTSLRQTQ